MTKPALLLLPNLLGEVKHHEPYLPSSVDKAVATIDGLIAESDRAARRFLDRFETKKLPTNLIPVGLIDEDVDFLLEPIRQGQRWGLISDAGLPCIGDPGSEIVRRARSSGILVQAFNGPCSFIHALMLSGLSGQNFTFHGYLGREDAQVVEQIKAMQRNPGTQIFMERPYRNQQMLELLLENLNDSTWLCAAWELMMPEQGVLSQPVSLWKKSPLPNLHKKNTVFIIQK